MQTRNTLTNALALIALAAGLARIIATWHTRQVQAITDPEDRPAEFGFIDLGAGQPARLNVVNLRHPPPDPDNPPSEPDHPTNLQPVRLSFDIYVQPPPDPDAPSCVTRYRFLRRESCDVMLMPGEAASVDFTAAEDAKVAASIHSLGGPDTLGGLDTREGALQITPEPHLVPTLEVQEAARTIFVVPGVIKGFQPAT